MATQKRQVYKCLVCGIVAEVLDAGAGEMVCCGRVMRLMSEQGDGEHAARHVPVVSADGDGLTVRIGAEPHPMEPAHHIQWIEVRVGDETHRKFLSPGDEPVADFAVAGGGPAVRTFCNRHGLWTA